MNKKDNYNHTQLKKNSPLQDKMLDVDSSFNKVSLVTGNHISIGIPCLNSKSSLLHLILKTRTKREHKKLRM